MPGIDRRELIRILLGGTTAMALPGCRRAELPSSGRLLAPDHSVGHKIRDGFRPQPEESDWRSVAVVIVGGGVAGLSAAWRLHRAGFRDFVLLELEKQPGGTAAFCTDAIAPYPWGAHYLTTPMTENRALIALLQEMGAVDGLDDHGQPIVGESFLCREPEERLFLDGTWIEGLYPMRGASPEDLRQLAAFRAEVDRLAATRDSQGRRLFAIPIASGSDEPLVTDLDAISMSDWMNAHGWTSPRLQWLVDYACRDDYGLTREQTSAWAGVFYFAARIRESGAESQAVITWPEGNGRIVDHLATEVMDQVRFRHAVCNIVPRREPREPTRVVAYDAENQRALGFHCERVIFAGPQFLARHLISGFSARTEHRADSFSYGAWVVANVHLRDRPANTGAPLSWDNVLHDSRSLGYVVATHQQGRDHGPSVFTWYYPLTGSEPVEAREQLLEWEWSDWAELVLTDLEQAHPDIRPLVSRLDVMRWGHAMIQPRPGFVWSAARQQAATPDLTVHFANTDLSGVALLEEAFYHGVRAAEEVMSETRHSYQTML